jgi:serine/threonine-protein kinase HipA
MSRHKSNASLNIYMNSKHVGVLKKLSHGGLEFKYSTAWIDSPQPIALSLSLPLQEDPYKGEVVSNYFDNLLPDSESVRKRLAESSNANSKEAFDILQAIGRDCVGALQLVPEDVDYELHQKIEGDVLNQKQIAQILENLKITPLGYDPEDDFRISIAGAQSKTALLRIGKSWLRPRGSTPTTHILKPAIGILPNGIDLSNSVKNEFLCLKLCEFFGLTTAKAEIISFEETPCLVVERFDRMWTKDKKRILRLPQEDFCQALGVGGTKKYEDRGGPGFESCMKLLQSSDQSSEDRTSFLRAQLVFFLLGATDGHAKNFSLFLNPTGFSMTPIYDVLSAEPALHKGQIRWNKYKMSMCFGKNRHYQINNLSFRHFEESCDLARFPKQDFYEIMTDLFARSIDLESFLSSFAKDVDDQLIGQILSAIKKRLGRIQIC